MQPDALDRARELADAIVAPGSIASDDAVDLAVEGVGHRPGTLATAPRRIAHPFR